jgi:hypothetical protein
MRDYENNEITEKSIVNALHKIAVGWMVKESLCDIIVDEAIGCCLSENFRIGHLTAYEKWEALHYAWVEIAAWYLQNYGLHPEHKDELYSAFWVIKPYQWKDKYPELIEEYEDWEKRFYKERGWDKRKGQGELFDEENF